MNADDIRAMAARILAEIAPEADLATVSDDEDLRDALDLDSMDFLNFLVGLGRESGHAIPDEDTARLRTLSGIVAYLEERGLASA